MSVSVCVCFLRLSGGSVGTLIYFTFNGKWNECEQQLVWSSEIPRYANPENKQRCSEMALTLTSGNTRHSTRHWLHCWFYLKPCADAPLTPLPGLTEKLWALFNRCISNLCPSNFSGLLSPLTTFYKGSCWEVNGDRLIGNKPWNLDAVKEDKGGL